MPGAERPRLLFAARRAPYPLDHGSAIRSYQLLTGLARSFETVFVTLAHDPRGPDGMSRPDELTAVLGDIEVIVAPGLGAGKRARQALSLPRRDSWTWARYNTPALSGALARAAAQHKPDLVHFDDLGVAQAGPLASVVNVYCSHNVEYTILRRGAAVGSPGRRLFNAVEERKVRREEQRAWRTMDLCLAVSPLDAQAMIAGGARRAEVCPNGAETVERLPLSPPAPGEPLRLLFVGSASYAPYERGLAWLVREVLPRVRERIAVTFDVVGIPPARPVHAEGVRYVGYVPAVRPYYETAHAFVVPMFEGSGTRLKIIEAAAYGRPIVSTPVGAEGLPLRAGEDYLQAESPADFAAAILELDRRWRDPTGQELERMLAGARAAIAPLAWPRVVEALVALYSAEIATRRARGDRPAASADAAGATP